MGAGSPALSSPRLLPPPTLRTEWLREDSCSLRPREQRKWGRCVWGGGRNGEPPLPILSPCPSRLKRPPSFSWGASTGTADPGAAAGSPSGVLPTPMPSRRAPLPPAPATSNTTPPRRTRHANSEADPTCTNALARSWKGARGAERTCPPGEVGVGKPLRFYPYSVARFPLASLTPTDPSFPAGRSRLSSMTRLPHKASLPHGP